MLVARKKTIVEDNRANEVESTCRVRNLFKGIKLMNCVNDFKKRPIHVYAFY